MENTLIDYGLPALFALSFLAATIVPIGSEWLLIALIVKMIDPTTAVMVATAGNFLGACTTYAIGWWGSEALCRKLLRISPEQINKAKKFYNKYGTWSLFFSWLPLVGDPICVLGGIARIRFSLFSILVFSGKLGRYGVIAALTLSAVK